MVVGGIAAEEQGWGWEVDLQCRLAMGSRLAIPLQSGKVAQVDMADLGSATSANRDPLQVRKTSTKGGNGQQL